MVRDIQDIRLFLLWPIPWSCVIRSCDHSYVLGAAHCLLPVCDRSPCLTTKVWLRVARKLSPNLSRTSYQYVAKPRRTRKTDKLNPENAGAIHKQKVQTVASKKKKSNEVRFEPGPARFQVQAANHCASTAMTEECETTTGIVTSVIQFKRSSRYGLYAEWLLKCFTKYDLRSLKYQSKQANSGSWK